MNTTKTASTTPVTAPVTAPAPARAVKKPTPPAPKAKQAVAVKSAKSDKLGSAGATAATAATVATPKATKALKVEKAKKPKLVRDSFTIPKAEYVVLDELKQRANKLSRPVKKSELLRAGLKALAALSDAAFLTALAQVPVIKTGRPASDK
jgi:hypothetical protein